MELVALMGYALLVAPEESEQQVQAAEAVVWGLGLKVAEQGSQIFGVWEN